MNEEPNFLEDKKLHDKIIALPNILSQRSI